MSSVKKIINSKSGAIYLITAKEQGKDSWFYVRVNKLKEPLLQVALETGELSISEYGEVLYSGWGKEPDADIAAIVDTMLEE